MCFVSFSTFFFFDDLLTSNYILFEVISGHLSFILDRVKSRLVTDWSVENMNPDMHHQNKLKKIMILETNI